MRAGDDVAPAGVRVGPGGPLVYADPGGLGLEAGDRVILLADGGECVGVVVIAPSQVVECPPLDRLARVVRRARPDEQPALRPAGAGRALLGSLEMADWAAERSGASGGVASRGDDRDGEQPEGEQTAPD